MDPPALHKRKKKKAKPILSGTISLILHAHIVKLKYITVTYLSCKMGNAFLLSKQFSFTLKILQGQLLG